MRERVASIFSRWEGIECVYLFGDRCEEKEFPLNFGIFLRAPVSATDIEKMRSALIDDIERALERVVDCVVLEEVHPLFIHEVLKKGERIYGAISPPLPSIPDFERGIRHER